MTGGGTSAGSLEHTSTWAVATVCFFFILLSIILEHSIHLSMNWLKRRRKTALYDAFGRLKSELMLLGILSLLLAVTQRSISRICIPVEVANRMLPCSREVITAKADLSVAVYGQLTKLSLSDNSKFNRSTKRDLEKLYDNNNRRRLADGAGGGAGAHETAATNANDTDSCSSKGKVSIVTEKGVQQLQNFIFVMAVTHTVYSVLTIAFGRVKMRRWKTWEKETQSTDCQNLNDPNKIRLPRQTTFGRRHATFTGTALQLWIKCFFRQFFNSVAKTDYLTLRQGFIMAHLSARQLNYFNFQKYIKHSLDEDFKVVISISPLMWFTVVIFKLVDLHGWHSYFWISFLPLLLVVTVGTKLQVVVAKMALRVKHQKIMITGSPLVEPDDDNFWFGRPRFVLDILHFILFLNAFEMAFFVWVIVQFGSDSCYHEGVTTIVRVVVAVAVQVICCYITLPLYALVTQMGSQFRGEIFEENVARALKQWHIQIRRNRKKKEERSLEKSPATAVMANEKKLVTSHSEFSAETSYKSKNFGEITEEYRC